VLGPAMCPYNSHHWDALMFFLLMSLILIGTLESPVPRLCLAFVAGLTGGLTVLCFQAFVPAVLGSFVTAALLLRATKSPQSQAARTIAVQLMGFLSIMVALLLYLSRTKTLPQMMNSTIWFILNQYGPSNEVPYGYSNWVDLLINSYDRIAGILAGLSFEIVVWAPLVVALSAIAWFARTGSPGTGNCKQQRIILWLVLAYGLWIAELHRPDIKRLFWGSQLLIILTFFFLQQFVYRLRSFRLSLRVICLFILTGLVLDASWFLKWHRLPACVLDTRRGPVSLSNDLPIVEELQKLTVPYEKVLVYPYDTSINFLTKTCFPSIYPFLQYHYHSPEQIGDTVRDMEKSKVRYVVWNMRVNVDSFKEFGFPNYEPVGRDERIMERYLLENYDSVKLYGHYRLMRRKGG